MDPARNLGGVSVMESPPWSSTDGSSTTSDGNRSAGAKAPGQKRKGAAMKIILHIVRTALRGLGALVSLAFAVQGAWLFSHPHVGNFPDFCHWVGQAVLGLGAGGAGCYLEVKSFRNRKHFTKFALNRLTSALFYVWLGFYIFGFLGSEPHVKPLLYTIGIVSWVVALGDLIVSCTSNGEDDGEETARATTPRNNPKAPLANDSNNNNPFVADSLEAGQRVPNPPTASLPAPAAAAPPGGWNNTRERPFGTV